MRASIDCIRSTDSRPQGAVLPEILVALTLTAFLTGAVVQICLDIHSGISRWERSIRARQMLNATLHLMSRDIRMAGCNPFGSAWSPSVDLGYGPDGTVNRFTLRQDKRGKSPGSYPDGDIQDPDERIEYQLDTDVLRRNHQPMASGISSNPDEVPPFVLVDGVTFGLVHVFLTAREQGTDMSLATSICLRNPI